SRLYTLRRARVERGTPLKHHCNNLLRGELHYFVLRADLYIRPAADVIAVRPAGELLEREMHHHRPRRVAVAPHAATEVRGEGVERDEWAEERPRRQVRYHRLRRPVALAAGRHGCGCAPA